MDPVNRLEVGLKATLARAIDDAMTRNLPQIEAAARDAIARGLAGALGGPADRPAASPSATPGTPAPQRHAGRGGRKASGAQPPQPRTPAPRTSPEEVTARVLAEVRRAPGITAASLMRLLRLNGIMVEGGAIRVALVRLLLDGAISVQGRFAQFYPRDNARPCIAIDVSDDGETSEHDVARALCAMGKLGPKVLEQIRETPGMTGQRLLASLAKQGCTTSAREVRIALAKHLIEGNVLTHGRGRFPRYYAKS
jgi:hypothetical protein